MQAHFESSLASKSLLATDPTLARLINLEAERQRGKIALIPSENFAFRAVRDACATLLANKYSEGYVGARYYEGQQYIARWQARSPST